MTEVIKKHIGRLSMYKGAYDPRKVYKRRNRTSLYYSEFESKEDGNTEAPVVYDESTKTFVFNTDKWQIISNGTWLWLQEQLIPEKEAAEKEKWKSLHRVRAPFYDEYHKKVVFPDVEGVTYDKDTGLVTLSDEYCDEFDIDFDEETKLIYIEAEEV